MQKLPAVSKDTLSDKAYLIIKEAIVSNQYKPGDLLIEENLAEQLAISRTPIRDALKKLQYEKIITVNANKKLVVSSVTKEDIEAVTPVRENLEILAVQMLSGHMDKIRKKQLKKLCQKCETIAKNGIEGSELEYLEADRAFHLYLAECTDNNFLYDMLESVHLVTKRYHILAGTINSHMAEAVSEHNKILECILDDNYSGAVDAMREHIDGVGARMLIK